MTMPTVEIDEQGRVILNDPDALAVITAVAKHNCRHTAELNRDRIQHFIRRAELNMDVRQKSVVITIINVDDPHGRLIADVLMPHHNWQPYRDRGEVPFARGLATRGGIEDILGIFDQDARDKLVAMQGVAVVVVDHNVAEVYPAKDFL
jgi:hypothetical protein